VKSRKLTCVTALILFAAVPTALASTTWYVNGVSGSNSNNCMSSTTACKSIGHAISLAATGDAVRVAAATYTENLTINITVTVIGAGASTTIIDGGASNTVVRISNSTAHVTVSKLTIRNGKAPSEGGCPFLPSCFTSGGGINNSGTLTLTSSTVSGNLAPIPCNFNGHFYICAGTASGGGIYNSGALTISNSIISGNLAGSYCTGRCFAFGGGIYNRGTLLMIQNSTFTSNGAGVRRCPGPLTCWVGGGAVDSVAGTVTLNNSTVEGNNTTCSGMCGTPGGAIANGSNLAMNNSAVSGNPAGGISNSGTATLQNSIVANNSGKDCGGTITSLGYNLSSDGSCKFNGPGDMNNTNPLLGPLKNNGGPTQTQALLPGSPAIDAGDPSGCRDSKGNLLKTDQRGMPRPDKEDKTGCDIGAYELQGD